MSIGDTLGLEPLFGRNMITDPFGDVAAAEQQAAAQKDALAQQQSLAQQAQKTFLEQSQKGIGYLAEYGHMGAQELGFQGAQAQGYLEDAQRAGLGELGASLSDARNYLGNGYNQGRGDLASGYGEARGDLGVLQGLQGYSSGATRSINSYDALGGRQDRVGGMLDQRGGLYGGFEQDPGYQFRKQQGEQAILNQASASGGRGSARTMQALADYNQGLASQEYGNFAARRQAEAGVAGGSDAQYAALLQGQAGRADAAALAAQQNQYGLAGMGYGAQGQLAGMAYGYGQQNAGMANQYGQQLAQMQAQYGQSVADQYAQYGGQMAQNASNLGAQYANLYGNIGSNMANVAIGVGGNAQQNANSLMGAYQNYAQYGGMTQQAQANSNRETAGMIASFFSDASLKADVVTVPGSRYERIGLRGVRWVWNDTANKHGLFGKNEGVIAQEVIEKYPQAVIEGREGFLMVDYGELDRLIESAQPRSGI